MTRFSLVVLGLLVVFASRGQNPSLSITKMQDLQTGVAVELQTLTSACFLSLATKVDVRATGPLVSAGGKTIPLSKIRLLATSIGGVTLAGSANEITLSTTTTNLLGNLLNVNLTSNGLTIRYRIDASDMGYAWEEGTYQTTLEFTLPGGTLCLGQRTESRTLTVTVGAFGETKLAGDAVLNLNTASDFVNGVAVDVINQVTTTSTTRYSLFLKARSSAFLADAVAAANQASPVSAGSLRVSPSPAQTGIGTPLTITASETPSAILQDAPAANGKQLSLRYAIPAAQTSGFTANGTYTLPLYLYSSQGQQNLPVSVTVNVKDIAEISVNHSQTELAFTSAADYMQGVSVTKTGHLTLSKTSPFNVYVRSATPALAQGTNQIPAGLVQVSVLNAGPGFPAAAAVYLSATPQLLIAGAFPTINKSVDIQYSIGPAAATQLLNKPAGTYSATVVYSFVAE
jgi:hypothetical protein